MSGQGAGAGARLLGGRVGDYRLDAEIGKGSFATVFRAKNLRSGEIVAIKAIARDKISQYRKLQENLETEIAILRKLDHPNIVRLLDLQRAERYYFLVFEYCDGGDLAHLIKRHAASGLRITEVQRLLRELAAGLEYCRRHNLIHRDLKPQNLLLTSRGDNATLKIADFGFARYVQPDDMVATLCGSPLYMAPEILKNNRYDAKADLWSVGTILYEMAYGVPPYKAENQPALIRLIDSTKTVRFPPNPRRPVPQALKALLLGLLKPNPVERISFEEFFLDSFVASQPSGGGDGDGDGDPESAGDERDRRRTSAVTRRSAPTSPTSNDLRVPATPLQVGVPSEDSQVSDDSSGSVQAMLSRTPTLGDGPRVPPLTVCTAPHAVAVPATVVAARRTAAGTAVPVGAPDRSTTPVPPAPRKTRATTPPMSGERQPLVAVTLLPDYTGSNCSTGSSDNSVPPTKPRRNPFKAITGSSIGSDASPSSTMRRRPSLQGTSELEPGYVVINKWSAADAAAGTGHSTASGDAVARSAGAAIAAAPGSTAFATMQRPSAARAPSSDLDALIAGPDAQTSLRAALELTEARASAVARLATRMAAKDPAAALALYVKVCDVIHERLIAVRNLVQQRQLPLRADVSALLQRLRVLFQRNLDTGRVYKEKLSGARTTAIAEQLLYQHVMQEGREAGVDEMMANYRPSLQRYQRALVLLDMLADERDVDPRDKEILLHHVHAFRERIHAIEAKLAGASSPTLSL